MAENLPQKHPGGRPRKFQSPQQLSDLIDSYFTHCDAGEEVQEITKRGELVKYTAKIPYTFEDLYNWLDSAHGILEEYEKLPEFSAIVSRARNKIHAQWIKQGLSDRYNSKIVGLCLAANNPRYRINQDNSLNISISFEDSLSRMISERRGQLPGQQPAAPCLSPPPDDPDTIDI